MPATIVAPLLTACEDIHSPQPNFNPDGKSVWIIRVQNSLNLYLSWAKSALFFWNLRASNMLENIRIPVKNLAQLH